MYINIFIIILALFQQNICSLLFLYYALKLDECEWETRNKTKQIKEKKWPYINKKKELF